MEVVKYIQALGLAVRDFVSFDTGFDDEAIILAAMHLLPIGHPAVLKDFGGWATSPQIAWEVRFALGASIDEPWEISNLESYLQKRGGNDTHRAYSFNEKLERAIQSSNWIVKVDKRYHLKAIWRLIRKIESEYAHLESRAGPLTPEEEQLYIRSRKKIALLHWSIKFGLPANISPVGIWLPGNIQEMTQAFTPGFLDAFYYNDAVSEGKFEGELNLINGQSTTYASERYTAGLLAGGHELNAAIYSLIPSGGGSGHMAGGARAKALPKATTRTVGGESYVPPHKAKSGKAAGPGWGVSVARMKQAVSERLDVLRSSGLNRKQIGPAISVAFNRRTGEMSKVYINNFDGFLPKNLHVLINNRIPAAESVNYIKTKSAGSHSEIYAVNELMITRPGMRIEDISVYTQQIGTKYNGTVKPPCPHCSILLKGVHYVQ